MPPWRKLLLPSSPTTQTILTRTHKLDTPRPDIDAETIVHVGSKLDTTAIDKRSGRSLLHWAAATGRNEFVSNLAAAGADINASDQHGDTALHTTILHGLIAGVSTLLSHGAETGMRNDQGWTALHLAAIVGNQPIVELLLAHGANTAIRCGSWKETTALHYAVMLGRMPVVRALIARGADVKVKDRAGCTAADCAVAVGREDVIALLCGGGSRPVGRDVSMIIASSSGVRSALQLMFLKEPRHDRFDCVGVV